MIMRKENNKSKAETAKKGMLMRKVPFGAQRLAGMLRAAQTVIMAAVFILSMTISVFADDDNPLAILTNFEDFIFGVIQIAGVIMCGYGIVQVGTSISTHDPSQRSMGILTLLGGLLVALAKQVLKIIGVI